ncbi:MAG: hypothetical protein EOM24_07630 [Chloroflexia bacterium]|nr:hypothetical protein [Chloroflexia bacterium]
MNQAESWKPLYRTGAVAALLAALLFRRNIGAEVSLFTGVEAIPTTAADWFSLLQHNPFVGLSFLAVFDLVNYFLVGIVFLALAAALWQGKRSMVALALAGGLVGITLNLAANISLTMLALSQRYANAPSTAQRADLVTAGQAILASNDPLAALPGTGALISLLLVALAGLLFSVLLLPSHRVTAIFGLLAGGCDLAYSLVFPLTPSAPVYLLLAAAGLFWMLWHGLVARFLWKHAKER